MQYGSAKTLISKYFSFFLKKKKKIIINNK